MVAAFRDDPRDPQLPFQQWAQPPQQGSSSPSFDYADPVAPRPVQINPPIRPRLSKDTMASGAIVVPSPPSRASSMGTQVRLQGQPRRRARVSQGQLVQSSAGQRHSSAMVHGAAVLPTVGRPSAAQSLAVQPMRARKSVVHLPKSTPYEPWVQRLMLGQKGLCVITLTLVGFALALYGQSVYQHRQWGHSFAHLERLQKLEQQGTAASETMKQSLAEEAELPESHMSSQMPDRAIEVETAPLRQVEDAHRPAESVLDLDLDGPMGY